MQKKNFFIIILLVFSIISIGIYFYKNESQFPFLNEPHLSNNSEVTFPNCTFKECDFFIDWLIKPLNEKESPTNGFSTKPLLSSEFIKNSFNNFSIGEVITCPLIEGKVGRSCWNNVNGIRINFSVQVNNLSLPKGYVIVYNNTIVEYDGPYSDFNFIINETQAANFIQNSSICQEAGKIDLNNPNLNGYIPYGEEPLKPEEQVHWVFKMTNIKKSGCGAVCIVNAVNGSVELNWMCTGALI